MAPAAKHHKPKPSELSRQFRLTLFEVTLQRGDLVLLCSDGLVDMIDDSEIERVLLSEPNLSSAVQTLIRLANEAGGDDNITVIVAKVM
jgi:serine/threonine protein phosphatase PrpC